MFVSLAGARAGCVDDVPVPAAVVESAPAVTVTSMTPVVVSAAKSVYVEDAELVVPDVLPVPQHLPVLELIWQVPDAVLCFCQTSPMVSQQLAPGKEGMISTLEVGEMEGLGFGARAYTPL